MLRIFTIILAVFICGACGTEAQYVPTIRIDLNEGQTYETQVRISTAARYILEFRFSRTNQEFEALKKLLGASFLCPRVDDPGCTKGVPIVIRWSLQGEGQDHIQVPETQVKTQDSSGWSQTYVSRHIGAATLKPGTYKLKVKIEHPVPELSQLTTDIVLVRPSK